MEGVIDFAPLFDLGIEIVTMTVLAVGGVAVAWVGKKVKDWLGLEIEKKHREALQAALHQAVNFGEKKVRNQFGGKLKLENKNEVLSAAATYAIASVPDALKAFKIDVASPEGQARIVDMIETRMYDYIFDDAQDDEFQEAVDR